MIHYVLANYRCRDLFPLLCDEYAWSLLKHLPGLEGLFLRRAYLRLFAGRYSPGATIQRCVTIRHTQRLRFGRNLYVNRGCQLDAFGGIELGDNVGLGPNVTIITNDHGLLPQGTDYRQRPFVPRKVVVGDNSMICAHCYLNPGVTIGRNVIVAAGTSVFADIPDDARVGPAPLARYTDMMRHTLRTLR